MSRAIKTLHCLVHHTLDILKLFNGCSVAVQIQIVGPKLMAGLHCMGRPILDTSRSPGYYSSTKPISMPTTTKARLHYISPCNTGTLMWLSYCSNTVPTSTLTITKARLPYM